MARHFEAAALPEKAAGYWMQAAQQASHILAAQEAMHFCLRGLSLLEQIDDPVQRAHHELGLQSSLKVAARAAQKLQ